MINLNVFVCNMYVLRFFILFVAMRVFSENWILHGCRDALLLVCPDASFVLSMSLLSFIIVHEAVPLPWPRVLQLLVHLLISRVIVGVVIVAILVLVLVLDVMVLAAWTFELLEEVRSSNFRWWIVLLVRLLVSYCIGCSDPDDVLCDYSLISATILVIIIENFLFIRSNNDWFYYRRGGSVHRFDRPLRCLGPFRSFLLLLFLVAVTETSEATINNGNDWTDPIHILFCLQNINLVVLTVIDQSLNTLWSLEVTGPPFLCHSHLVGIIPLI